MSERSDIIPDGLPDHLPKGEHLIWQGSPNWVRLAIDAFHVRKITVYFAGVIALQIGYRFANGHTVQSAFANVPALLACAAVACAILSLIAFFSARTSRYTLTNKRALMRIGIALPINVNIPYSKIDGVSFAETGAGAGTICFKPGGDVRLAYAMMWPHVKPWHFSKPEPAFRDITNVEKVASQLAELMGGRLPDAHTFDANTADVSQPHLVAAE